jgi:hypothetical protein
MLPTIEVDVRVVNVEDVVSKLESRAGSQQGIRKNPHVIDAGSKQDLPVSYWCITLMEISTILH